MSRIGRRPVAVPSGVEVTLAADNLIRVKGPKGTLERTLNPVISLKQEGGVITLERPNEERQAKSLHGLTRTLVDNMIIGVTTGFKKELEIVGTGYRCIAKGPNAIELALGFSHAVNVKAPEGVSFEVPAPTRVVVSGINKEVVGQVAADIRKLRKPEPYKGKGVRYVGEYVARKAGKAGKK